jgi:hypothetical protein
MRRKRKEHTKCKHMKKKLINHTSHDVTIAQI